MVAKMTVWALTWEKTVARARRALDEFVVRGVPTNIPLYREIVRDPDFLKGDFGVKFLEEKLAKGEYDFEIEGEKPREDLVLAISAAIAAHYGL